MNNLTDITARLIANIETVIVGKRSAVELSVATLLSGGHMLIEDIPGVGKTMLARALAKSVGGSFRRIQFTPDLLPSDITGVSVYHQDTTRFEFRPGPVFANVVLADEINRATPKSQAALLEAMEEFQVTADGETRPLPDPFFVVATENPIEMEGTYPLPEAQLDRFLFKLKVRYPSERDLVEIIERTTKPVSSPVEKAANGGEVETLKSLVREVPVPQPVKEYVSRIILSTRPDFEGAPEMVRRFVRYGSSPRGAQALVLGGKVLALMDGRFNVSFEDVRNVTLAALRHRLILSFEGEAEGVDPDQILEDVLAKVPTQPAKAALLPEGM